jgi:hypothetical protein
MGFQHREIVAMCLVEGPIHRPESDDKRMACRSSGFTTEIRHRFRRFVHVGDGEYGKHGVLALFLGRRFGWWLKEVVRQWVVQRDRQLSGMGVQRCFLFLIGFAALQLFCI